MRDIRFKKGNILIYSILLVIIISIMISLKQCGSRQLYSPRTIGGSEGDTLDVAIIYSPTSYYLYDDTIGGLNYDLIRTLSADLKVPVRFWPVVSLEDALNKLENKDFDILASLPIDQDFNSRFIYTEPIFLDRQVLVQRCINNGKQRVNSSLDLAGDTLHIEKDSPIEFRIRNLSREIGDTIYIVSHPELSGEFLFLKVASGELRYAVVNERIAKPLLAEYPDVSINTPISFTQFQAWLLHREDTILQRRLNTWIDSIKLTPSYVTFKARYDL